MSQPPRIPWFPWTRLVYAREPWPGYLACLAVVGLMGYLAWTFALAIVHPPACAWQLAATGKPHLVRACPPTEPAGQGYEQQAGP